MFKVLNDKLQHICKHTKARSEALDELSSILGDRKSLWFSSLVTALNRTALEEIVLRAAAADPKIRDLVRTKSLEPQCAAAEVPNVSGFALPL